MPNEELVAYIKRQLQNGHSATVVQEHLLNHGHKRDVAKQAMKDAGAHVNPRSSLKGIAFVVLALFVLSGLGFGGYSLFFSSNDLAGAATEPIFEEVQEEVIELIVDEVEEPAEYTAEQESTESEQNEVEQSETEEISEAVVDDETEEESISLACSGTNSCSSQQTCYESTCQADADKDQLPDTIEASIATNAYKQDTDEDGVSDYDEYMDGTDPLDTYDPESYACTYDTDCIVGEACSIDGLCITCSDSDESYKTHGVTTGVFYSSRLFTVSQDSCDTQGNLIEYHCRENNYLYYENVDCAAVYGDAYSCNNGICSK
jgi:hypothetical protein